MGVTLHRVCHNESPAEATFKERGLSPPERKSIKAFATYFMPPHLYTHLSKSGKLLQGRCALCWRPTSTHSSGTTCIFFHEAALPSTYVPPEHHKVGSTCAPSSRAQPPGGLPARASQGSPCEPHLKTQSTKYRLPQGSAPRRGPQGTARLRPPVQSALGSTSPGGKAPHTLPSRAGGGRRHGHPHARRARPPPLAFHLLPP